MNTLANYKVAKEIYSAYGIDTDLALERLKNKLNFPIQCW